MESRVLFDTLKKFTIFVAMKRLDMRKRNKIASKLHRMTPTTPKSLIIAGTRP
jgi:hypothetical protein